MTAKARQLPPELREGFVGGVDTPAIPKPAESIVRPLVANAILEITGCRSVRSTHLRGRVESDGTVTAVWSGREVRDARRGFLLDGLPLSPTCRQAQWGRVSIRLVNTDRRYT